MAARQKQTDSKVPRLTADQLIDAMKVAPPKVVAWLLGLSTTRAINENLALAELRSPDGTFDCAKVFRYATTTRRRRTDRAGDVARMNRDSETSGADGVAVDGTILDYKRKLEAKKLELQLLEAEKKVVSVDHVRDFLILVASRLKELGNGLQAEFGRGALEMLNETLLELEATVGRWDKSLAEDEITI